MMYIDKWWYDFIGGTDDSLTLLDYISETEEIEYSFGKLLKDFNIKSNEPEFYRSSPSVFYTTRDGYEHDIHYVIDLIQDLSVLVLESYKSGAIKLSDLTKSEDKKVFKILCSKEELELLIKILTDFAKAPLTYEISEMVDEKDMIEIARQCTEIAEELRAYL